MPKRKQTRRRASLPLEPHVQAAFQRVRRSYYVLNAIALLENYPLEVQIPMFCSAARDLANDIITFNHALHCSVDDPTQPPTQTIKE